MATVASKSWVMLGRYRSPDLGITHEARSAHLQGPQHACHLDMLEFSMLEHGLGHGLIDGHQQTFCAGQYTLIAPGLEHSSWTSTQPALESNIHLSRDLVAQVAADLGLARAACDWPAGCFAAPPAMLGIHAALKQAMSSSDSGQHLLMQSLGVSLVVLLLQRHVLRATAEAGPAPDHTSRKLGEVEELLRLAPAEPHTIAELARVAGMSRYHFLRSFKKRYGLPPYAYLTRIRIERAAELLCQTELSVTAIAFELGFGSSGRFAEAFKRTYGTSPARWRREA